MLVSGTGITPFTAKILPGYRPLTSLAIKWRKKADGNYSGTDRGSSADVYQTKIALFGKESVINNFIDEVEANRTAQSHVLQLSTFSDTEYIFGRDVDHSGTINATIVEMDDRGQQSWKSWGLEMRLQMLSPAFSGSPSFPTLEYLDIGASGDSTRTVTKYDSYSGNFTYLDHNSDIGAFTGTFLLSDADMLSLRRYIATQRTGDFTLSDTFGYDYPFGSRSANSYPFTCKLIDCEDLGMWGTHWWKIKLTFVEVITITETTEYPITTDNLILSENVTISLS